MGKAVTVLAFDIALANASFALLRFDEATRHRPKRVTSFTVKTDSTLPLHERLLTLYDFGREAQLAYQNKYGDIKPPDLVAVENFSRNSKFHREEMGAAFAAVVMGLSRSTVRKSKWQMVTPRAAKIIACPKWPGLNKDNWIAAGRDPAKFKASMPDKQAVMNGLVRRFNIVTTNEHHADAVCVGIAGAQAHWTWAQERTT